MERCSVYYYINAEMTKNILFIAFFLYFVIFFVGLESEIEDDESVRIIVTILLNIII